MYKRASPVGESDFQSYVLRELEQIERAFTGSPFLQLMVRYTAPPKPREGMVVFADGVKWNPGNGKGFYGYDGTAWNKL